MTPPGYKSSWLRHNTIARATLSHVPTAIATALEDVDVNDYDVIFVDDSTETKDRVRTIQVVAKRCSYHPVVVIHDFETREYQAAKGFHHRFAFTALTPKTGWFGTGQSQKAHPCAA